jgi:hypothetical protein
MNIAKRVLASPGRAARLDDRAVASLALGVAGLFMFNIVFGPFAIVLGAMSARRHRTSGRKTLAGSHSGRLHVTSRTAALLGVALGIADLVVLAVLVVSKVHGGNFVWHP